MVSLQTVTEKTVKEYQRIEKNINEILAKQLVNFQEISTIRNTLKNVLGTRLRTVYSEGLNNIEKLCKPDVTSLPTTVLTLIGNAGVGKSTYIDTMMGIKLLPSSKKNKHITKSLFKVQYGSDYSLEIIRCTDEELRERQEETKYQANPNNCKLDTRSTRFTTLQSLKDAIERRQSSMTKDDCHYVKFFRISAPIQLLKDEKLEIIDVPGLFSGEDSLLFNRLAVEACLLADIINVFPNNFRSIFPTDIFEIVRKVFSHHSAQRSPKMFVFTYGGHFFRGSKEFSYSLEEQQMTEKKNEFSNLLEDFFDFKFDDIPIDNSNRAKISDNMVEFIESKSLVLGFLKDNFMSYPIPNLDCKNYSIELKVTKSFFKLTIMKDKLVKATRLVEEIGQTVIICLPKLISCSKHQTRKYDDEFVDDIMTTCQETIECILVEFRKFKKNNSSKKKIAGKIDKYLPDNFLTEDVVFNTSKPHEIIQNHLILLENNIRTLAYTYFVSESSGNVCDDYNGFKSMVKPMFDKTSDDHVILATETKGVLKDILKSYLDYMSNKKYEFNFRQNYARLNLFQSRSKNSLSLPNNSLYSNTDEMKQAKLFNNRDEVNNYFRKDKTCAEISVENILPNMPIQSNNRIIITQSMDNTIEISNVDPNSFSDCFKTLIPSHILLDHNKITRIAPVFIISNDEDNATFYQQDIWKEYTENHLVYIVKPLGGMNEGVLNSNNLINIGVSNENGFYSDYSLMNAVCHFANLCKFPIIHVVSCFVKEISEFNGKTKQYQSHEFTPIRYFRSAESIIYNEINSLDANRKEQLISEFILKMNKAIYSNDISEIASIKKILTSQDKTGWIDDISQFLANLNQVDKEINLKNPSQVSDLESRFKSAFFSMNKGRVSCYDGRDNAAYGDKILSRDGYNYMISNGMSGVETFYLPSMQGILPVPDYLMMRKFSALDPDFDLKTLMYKFRCNMLSNGVGGFFHLGFKLKKKIQRQKRINKKRKNSGASSSNKKKKTTK